MKSLFLWALKSLYPKNLFMIRFFLIAALIPSFFVSKAQDIIVSMTGKTTFAPNEEFVNAVTVKNTGIVFAANFDTSVYISTDAVWQATDKVISSLYCGGLQPGQSLTLSHSTLASILASPGNYFLIVKADKTNRVIETDETNNQFVIAVVVTSPQIDFAFDSFTLSKTSFTQNEKIAFAYSVSNLSQVDAGGALEIGLYLSTDATWSTDDKFIQYDWKYFQGADAAMIRTDTDQSTFYIPSSGPGSYYLITKIDRDDTFIETNEANNTVIKAITLQASFADLQIDSFYQPQPFTAYSAEVIVSVTNKGTTPAGPVNLYGMPLSGNYQFPTPGIRRIEEYILPGETKLIQAAFDNFDGPGSIPFKLIVNYGEPVIETNYNNNTYTAGITTIPPLVESYALRGMSFSGSYDNTDKDLSLLLNLENTSNNPTYYNQFYVVEIRNSNNVVVHAQNVYPSFYAAPGMSQSVPVALTLNAPLPVGQYQANIKCYQDYDCKTTFAVSAINLTISPIQYILTGTIKGEDGIPITKGNLFLYQQTDDGTIKFIQKITPTTSSSFSFPVDTHKHTLYFIPDRYSFPDYVPTVYGKTLTLENESLLTLTQNTSVQFEIIKVHPMQEQGDGVISGAVTNESDAMAGRVSALSAGTPVADAPVVLLSSTGTVNGITYTNADGYYEFKHLPRTSYQLIIPHELNVTGMEAPYLVAIDTKNAEVNFTSGTDGPTIQEQVLLFEQTIRFDALPVMRYGANPVLLAAQSSSGMPVTFTLSDPAVAELKEGLLQIKGAGVLTISAIQKGNNFYQEEMVSQKVTINKGDQFINFAVSEYDYSPGDLNFELHVSSGLEAILTSSDEAIVSIKDGLATAHKAGKVTLTASQPGDKNYLPAEAVSKTITINVVTAIEQPASVVTIYPNPAAGTLFIDTSDSISDLQITDVLGRPTTEWTQAHRQINIENLSSGTYLLKIISPSQTQLIRFVKK